MDKNNSQRVTYIGYANWRMKNIRFGIKEEDRYSTMYCLGKTGSGKTTLIFNLAKQDIENGNAVAILDAHGDLAESLVKIVHAHRKKDLVYFDATNLHSPIAFNPLANTSEDQRNLLVSEIVSFFQKSWDSWGVNIEFLLRHCIIALSEYPGTTLLHIEPFLTHKAFRHAILKKVTSKSTVNYWMNVFDAYSPSQQQTSIAPILNKVGALSSNTVIKSIIGQRTGSISINEIVDNGKILIVNLSKGQIGEQACVLLGSMITTGIQMAVLRKARYKQENRKPFFYYIDEAQSYLSVSFGQILSECRKYKLGVFIAHQFTEQIPAELKEAILGNAGTIITFRLGIKDARIFKEEMYPVFSVDDFINLPRFYFYIKLLIDGVASKAFSAFIDDP